jgi:hypothetical protein
LPRTGQQVSVLVLGDPMKESNVLDTRDERFDVAQVVTMALTNLDLVEREFTAVIGVA